MAAGVSSTNDAFPLMHPPKPYKKIIATPCNEYDRFYKQYSAKPKEIERLITVWTDRHSKLKLVEEGRTIDSDPFTITRSSLKTEFNQKVQIYTGYRRIRDDIPRIIQLYDAAISGLNDYTHWTGARTTSPMDAKTLIVLAGIEVLDLNKAKKKYDEIFTTGLNKLHVQRAEMVELQRNITAVLIQLKSALEELGARVDEIVLKSPLGRSVPQIN